MRAAAAGSLGMAALFTAVLGAASTQAPSPSVADPPEDAQSLARALADYGVVEGSDVGHGGVGCGFVVFERLAAVASAEELARLAGHESAVVRAYAARAIASGGPDASQPLCALLDDRARVSLVDGCVPRRPRVSEIAFDEICGFTPGERARFLSRCAEGGAMPEAVRDAARRCDDDATSNPSGHDDADDADVDVVEGPGYPQPEAWFEDIAARHPSATLRRCAERLLRAPWREVNARRP